MKSRIEEELRELFEDSASRFHMDPTFPTRPVERARRRGSPALAIVGVAVVASIATVVALQSQYRGPTQAAHEGSTTVTPSLRLVDYVDPGEEGSSGEPDGSGLKQYVECMRGQGFDLPDPVRTEQGWSILVPPGSIDRSDPKWREAAFVTCRLDLFIGHPLTGDLVMSFPFESGLITFVACMRNAGFVLPAATRSGDEYRFDLGGTNIDTSTEAWNRAIFLTCSPPFSD